MKNKKQAQHWNIFHRNGRDSDGNGRTRPFKFTLMALSPLHPSVSLTSRDDPRLCAYRCFACDTAWTEAYFIWELATEWKWWAKDSAACDSEKRTGKKRKSNGSIMARLLSDPTRRLCNLSLKVISPPVCETAVVIWSRPLASFACLHAGFSLQSLGFLRSADVQSRGPTTEILLILSAVAKTFNTNNSSTTRAPQIRHRHSHKRWQMTEDVWVSE